MFPVAPPASTRTVTSGPRHAPATIVLWPPRLPFRISLSAAERNALTAWVVTRIALYWIVALAAWLVGDDKTLPDYLERWNRWDARVFTQIAQYGYSGPPGEPGQFNAFFPGVPLLERALHVVIPSWGLCSLLIPFVAGAVAVVALVRLVADVVGTPQGEDIGRRAVWALCLSPMTVFLTAGYSEAVFLAFSLTAWLNARRGRWAVAALLAAGAGATRISGLFLVAALFIQLLSHWVRDRRHLAHLRDLLCLACAVAPAAAFFAYLHSRTGQGNAYFEAEAVGWGRRYIGVTDTFHLVWAGASDPGDHAAWALGYRLDILAMALFVAIIGWLAVRRRWAELCYVAAPPASLAAMSTYSTASRTTLLLWPIWLAAGMLSSGRRWGSRLTYLYLAISLPLAVLLAAAFSLWHWAG